MASPLRTQQLFAHQLKIARLSRAAFFMHRASKVCIKFSCPDADTVNLQALDCMPSCNFLKMTIQETTEKNGRSCPTGSCIVCREKKALARKVEDLAQQLKEAHEAAQATTRRLEADHQGQLSCQANTHNQELASLQEQLEQARLDQACSHPHCMVPMISAAYCAGK